jgi:hypothetical protein
MLMMMSAAAHADDSRGMFSVKSVGTVSCRRYLDARREKGEEYLLFAGYLGGYMTAYNQLSPETFDILPWQTVDTLLGLLTNYCSKQPDRNFAVAVNELIKLLTPNRLEAASELVEARTQQGSVKIYRETMRRVQVKLADLGHYSGNADGLFGSKTRGGLEKFQEAKGLKKTGLPDQPTLLNLLLVERAIE